MKCPICKKEKNVIKYGKIGETQRYKCKNCNYQFSKPNKNGKPLEIKLLAFYMYLNGANTPIIARAFKVSATAVSKWIKDFKSKYKFNRNKKGEFILGINTHNIYRVEEEKDNNKIIVRINFTKLINDYDYY